MADRTITELTELLATAVESGDLLVVYDTSSGQTLKLSIDKLLGFFLTSWAAGDIIYHDGTKFVRLAKGSATQVLTMNSGATAPEWAPAVQASDIQEYTASGTWNKPTRGSKALIEVWGAGGGGGTGTSGGGGGGGSYVWRIRDLADLSSTETVTIGNGGATRTGSDQNGNDGQNSSFGTHVTAYGGAGGLPGRNGGGGGGGLGASSTQNGGPPDGAVTTNNVGEDSAFGGGSGGSGDGPRSGGSSGDGGGGGGSASSTATGGDGGNSIRGGAGGGGASNGGSSATSGGTSVDGGDGGDGGAGGANAQSGSVPGGGGGGADTGNSGAGGDGFARVTVW